MLVNILWSLIILTEQIAYHLCTSDLILWYMISLLWTSKNLLFLSKVYTMEELKLTGNHLKRSHPILTFSSNFDKVPCIFLVVNSWLIALLSLHGVGFIKKWCKWHLEMMVENISCSHIAFTKNFMHAWMVSFMCLFWSFYHFELLLICI